MLSIWHTLYKNNILHFNWYRRIEPNKNNETEDFQLGKNLSMILEASKERNSSTSSGIISSSVTKVEQQSSIDFGMIICVQLWHFVNIYVFLNILLFIHLQDRDNNNIIT